MSDTKQKRHELLLQKLKESPFITDRELAVFLHVSIATIRLDRQYLNIPELRERTLNAAESAHVVSGSEAEILDIEPDERGISVMMTSEEMCFPGIDMVKCKYIYAMAEDIATAVTGYSSVLIDVADIKYKKPVRAHAKLLAKCELKRIRTTKKIVWVTVYCEKEVVFRFKGIVSDNSL